MEKSGCGNFGVSGRPLSAGRGDLVEREQGRQMPAAARHFQLKRNNTSEDTSTSVASLGDLHAQLPVHLPVRGRGLYSKCERALGHLGWLLTAVSGRARLNQARERADETLHDMKLTVKPCGVVARLSCS